MKPVAWILSFALGWAVATAIYDAGQRSIIRDCHEFHTFTYGRNAYGCVRLKTPKEVARKRAVISKT